MNELRNGVIQNLATAPSPLTAGRIYFDTALNCLRVYSGRSALIKASLPLTSGSVPLTSAKEEARSISVGVAGSGSCKRSARFPLHRHL